MEIDRITIEQTTHDVSNDREATRLIASINGGFLVMATITPGDSVGTDVEVRYTSAWKTSALAIKHWLTDNYPLCSSYSENEPEDFIGKLNKNYQLESDRSFIEVVDLVTNQFYRCHDRGYRLVDFVTTTNPEETVILSAYTSGPFSIGPLLRVEVKRSSENSGAKVSVWYKGSSERSGKAIERWISEDYTACKI